MENVYVRYVRRFYDVFRFVVVILMYVRIYINDDVWCCKF